MPSVFAPLALDTYLALVQLHVVDGRVNAGQVELAKRPAAAFYEAGDLEIALSSDGN